VWCVEDEEGGVTFGGVEAESMEVGGEAEEPGPGRLFEAVEGFAEFAHMCGVGGIDEAGWLSAVDCLS
jgi:hypothetical protein